MRPVKDFIHHLFWSAGYQISRIPEPDKPWTSQPDLKLTPRMRGGFQRVRFQNTAIASIIDVGASDGRWTCDCLTYFPNARYLLIEALAVHEPKLQALQNAFPNVEYVIAAAGDHEGQAHFFQTADPFGGVTSHEAFNQFDIAVPSTTLDIQVAQHRLPPPYCIKLDTHGFEVPILEGATQTLRETELIVVEVYNFDFPRAEPNLRFHQMCAYMESKGFRCSDLVDPIYRAKDYLLWQMDLFFVPSTRAEFEYKGFN